MSTRFAAALVASFAVLLAVPAHAKEMTPEIKAKVDAKLKDLRALAADPKVVAAVKEFNAAPPAAAKEMTQEKWKGLSMLDPFVRGLSKNAVAEHLKAKKDASVVEMFLSGADGTKVALLAKTTSWSHKGKDKHDLPMKGKEWTGPVEVDESSGVESVQVALPVVEGGKPIGSVVFGLATAKL
ncbi:MAG: hypothetical protein QM765_42005 [Myxococcales bacterium]